MQRWWRALKGRNTTIRQGTFKNFHSKLLTRSSVTDARRSVRPSTFRSEQNVAMVRVKFFPIPLKSTREAARESGLSRHTVRTVLKKHKNIRTCELHYVQAFTRWLGRRRFHEWPKRNPVITPCDFSCEAGRKTVCTRQIPAQLNNRRTGFGTLSPTSNTTSCRRLYIPSPVV